MLCTKCNNQVNENEKFCPSCGTKIQNEENIDMVLADLEKMIIEKSKEDIEVEVKELDSKYYEKEYTPNESEKIEDIEEVSDKKVNKVTKIIVLIIILLVSILLNIFLLINLISKSDTKKDIKISSNKSKILLNNYYVWVPDNWINVFNVSSLPEILDETETWKTSIEFLETEDFDLVLQNKDNIKEKFGLDKYFLTSDYTKKLGNTDILILKGKYYENSAYIIFASNDGFISIANLKFKDEVNENVLTAVMNILVSSSKVERSENLNDDSDFEGVTNIIKSILKEEE